MRNIIDLKKIRAYAKIAFFAAMIGLIASDIYSVFVGMMAVHALGISIYHTFVQGLLPSVATVGLAVYGLVNIFKKWFKKGEHHG